MYRQYISHVTAQIHSATAPAFSATPHAIVAASSAASSVYTIIPLSAPRIPLVPSASAASRYSTSRNVTSSGVASETTSFPRSSGGAPSSPSLSSSPSAAGAALTSSTPGGGLRRRSRSALARDAAAELSGGSSGATLFVLDAALASDAPCTLPDSESVSGISSGVLSSLAGLLCMHSGATAGALTHAAE